MEKRLDLRKKYKDHKQIIKLLDYIENVEDICNHQAESLLKVHKWLDDNDAPRIMEIEGFMRILGVKERLDEYSRDRSEE